VPQLRLLTQLRALHGVAPIELARLLPRGAMTSGRDASIAHYSLTSTAAATGGGGSITALVPAGAERMRTMGSVLWVLGSAGGSERLAAGYQMADLVVWSQQREVEVRGGAR
jgi:hypothetical protein